MNTHAPKKIAPRWYWKTLSRDGLLKEPMDQRFNEPVFSPWGYETEQQALDAFHKVRYENYGPYVLLKMYESVLDMD